MKLFARASSAQFEQKRLPILPRAPVRIVPIVAAAEHQQRLSPPSSRARVTRVAVAMLQMQAPHARVGAAGAACRRSTRARGARVARCVPIAAAASDAAAATRVDEIMLLGKTQRASHTSCGAVARSHWRLRAGSARHAALPRLLSLLCATPALP
jgi:hypothetical protein